MFGHRIKYGTLPIVAILLLFVLSACSDVSPEPGKNIAGALEAVPDSPPTAVPSDQSGPIGLPERQDSEEDATGHNSEEVAPGRNSEDSATGGQIEESAPGGHSEEAVTGSHSNEAAEEGGKTADSTHSSSNPPPAVQTDQTERTVPRTDESPTGSTSSQPQPQTQPEPESVSGVHLTIVGPEDVGMIMEGKQVELKKGDTVLDILKRATREEKIQMEYRGAKGLAYVEGINNIYEFDHGATSGWVFSVNGELSNKSAGAHQVSEGDRIHWIYSLDLGKDVEEDPAVIKKE